MKNWNQTTEQIEAIIATGKQIQIVSGEGENGTAEDYTGAKTVRAIKARQNVPVSIFISFWSPQ